MSSELKLCYVDGSWAYFTTQELSEQWGDDWNDAPYEHNAGTPYKADKKRGEDWQIAKIAWDGDFEAPCDIYSNSPYSVDQINGGAVPWLVNRWAKNITPIQAGITIDEFRKLIRQGGGKVYEEVIIE